MDQAFTKRVLEELTTEGHQVVVHSQYHVQVIGEGVVRHNLWFSRDGLKFQAHGQREAEIVKLGTLKDKLRQYNASATDLAAMNIVQHFIQRVPIRSGIFTDAGFKDGHAKIAVIRINGQDVDVCVRNIVCEGSNQAEDAAIKLAIALYPGDETIYNDCEGAVNINQPRAKWISRKDNKEADYMSRKRKKR